MDLDDGGRVGVGSEAKPGKKALQGRRPQRLGGAVACAARPVEPAAALDGLGGAHHDGELLGDQRTDAPALPQRKQQDG